MKRRDFLGNVALFTGSSLLVSFNPSDNESSNKHDQNENLLNEKDNKKITAIQVTVPSSVGSCYYVRVTLDGEHLAWSSPIWINA